MSKIIRTKNVEFGGRNLMLRLDGKTIVQAEKQLGKSMIELFMTSNGMKFPMVGELLLVLQATNTSHSLKVSDMYDLYDNYLDAGNSFMDLFELLQEVMVEAGYFPKDKVETDGESLVTVKEAELIEEVAEKESLV